MAFRRDNHYVPCLYLRRFASSNERVFTYRTLVSRPQVPLWKERSISGVGYHAHLYTRVAVGRETDEIEEWLGREFETPAADAIERATSGARLTSSDWRDLVRFVAAQDVRTPARLLENLQRWRADTPGLLTSTLQESVRKIEAAKKEGKPVALPEGNNSEYLPVHVTVEADPERRMAKLKGEIVVGRGLWLFSIRHLLTRTINVLHQHRWSILRPPDGSCWFTSDDPVIRLNYAASGAYDFRGGWGSPGTEIYLPLSPNHLLYTRIGHRPPPRGYVVPTAQADMIRRFIAEHAHLMVFAPSPQDDVQTLRPRVVDDSLLRDEDVRWRNWHDEQTAAERKLSSQA
jgi:hypothetical protein